VARLHPWVVVKTPTTKEGLKATKCLVADGIKVNMTLCFSASQALLVAKAGGTYVSPFLGRLDDISHVGMDLTTTSSPYIATTASGRRFWPPRCVTRCT